MPVNISGWRQLPKWLVWALLCSVFCAVFWWQSWNSVNQSLGSQLQQQLPQKLKDALYYGDKNGPVSDLIRHQLERDLAAVSVDSQLALLQQCRARVVQLTGNSLPHSESGPAWLTVRWALDSLPQFTQLHLQCDTRWSRLLLPASAALLVVLFIYWLPQPVSPRCREIQHYLRARAVLPREALHWARLLSPLSPRQIELFKLLFSGRTEQLAALIMWLQQPQLSQLNEQQTLWFKLAMQQFSCTKEQALDVALRQDELHFDPAQAQLTIRGLAISLTKTPYFYYLT